MRVGQIKITNPSAIAIILHIQQMRGSKTSAGTAAEIVIERGISLGIDPHVLLTSPHVPLNQPPTTKSQGRAGAVNSSRSAKGRPCRKSA